jgi:predicted transcriptional regulator
LGEFPFNKSQIETRSSNNLYISNSIGFEDNIYTSCLTPDGKRLVKCIGAENRLAFFDISGESLNDELSNFDLTLPTPCPVVHISKSGTILAAGGGWNESEVAPAIYLINISSQKLENTIIAPHQYFEMSLDGKYLVTNNQDFDCSIYWVSNGSKKLYLDGYYLSTKFSRDSKHLAAYSPKNNGLVEVFKFPEMTREFMLPRNANFSLCPNRSNMFSWSKDGEFLAVTFADDNIIKIINTNTWQIVQELSPNFRDYNYTSSVFSPFDDYLAIGTSVWVSESVSLGVQVFDTKTWSMTHDESELIDYNEDILDVLKTTGEFYNNEFILNRTPILDSLTWRPDGSIYLSVTMFDGSKPINPNINDDVPPENDPSDNGIPTIVLQFIIITFTIILIFLTITYYFRPYHILAPFYSKLDPNDLENQVTRKSILQFIQTHPGCIFSEIKRSLQGSYSNFYYHLSVLERERLVYFKFNGMRKQFYSSNYPKFSKLFEQLEQRGLHEKIFLLLLKSPGLTQKEIAIKLKISEATVSRYIIDLLMENFIWRERDGKVWRCYSNPFTEASA